MLSPWRFASLADARHNPLTPSALALVLCCSGQLARVCAALGLGLFIMPALQDFATFVNYAQEVARKASTFLTLDDRDACSSMIRKILREARADFGAGPAPAQVFEESARAVVDEDDFGGDTLVILARLEEFHFALMKNTTKGYGVIDSFSTGSLNAAVVCACIDALEEDGTPGSRRWRNAMRSVVAGKGDGNTPTSGQRDAPRATENFSLQQTLRVMIIAAAFDKERSPMKLLVPLNFSDEYRLDAPNIMTLFGAYVKSESVRALDILWDVVGKKPADVKMDQAMKRQTRQGIASVVCALRALHILGDGVRKKPADVKMGEAIKRQTRQGIESVMWNLRALDDENEMAGSADSVADSSIQSTLGLLYPTGSQRALDEDARKLARGVLYSMERAGVANLSYFAGAIRDAQRAFKHERAAAEKDVERFAVRRGIVYVEGLVWQQAAAWFYILAVFVVAASCGAQNWGDRDKSFERTKDVFDVLTIFLVSVFGLIKLTSEDPNALKNLATGKHQVDDLSDAAGLLSTGQESMQKLLCTRSKEVEWVSAVGCCYGRAVHGDGGISAGLAKVVTLKQCGFFFLECICKRPEFWGTSVTVEKAQRDVAHIDPLITCDSDEDVGQKFSVYPVYTKLS